MNYLISPEIFYKQLILGVKMSVCKRDITTGKFINKNWLDGPASMKEWRALSLKRIYGSSSPLRCHLCELLQHSILIELSERMHPEIALNGFDTEMNQKQSIGFQQWYKFLRLENMILTIWPKTGSKKNLHGWIKYSPCWYTTTLFQVSHMQCSYRMNS